MAVIYKVLSRLLDYPYGELFEHLDEIEAVVDAAVAADPAEWKMIKDFVAGAREAGVIGLQQEYVDTFDMVPEHSLHLTHHLFGDDRGRGPALVELGEHYKADGYAAVNDELPDYLPLILEYVATLDAMQVRVFLADAAKVTRQVAAALEKAGSRYAPLVRIVEQHGSLARAA